jgi:Glycosyl transferase family 2
MTIKKRPTPNVAILMGTYNGEQYIQAQLESIKNQSHKNYFLVASDDGSSDNTLNIIKENFSTPTKASILKGPKGGFSKNFISLAVNKDIKADYYAFCDQDDVWDRDKIACAIEILDQLDNDKPLLYCARTRLVSESLENIGESQRFYLPKTFENALAQSLASGNTMVFNHATKMILEKAGMVEVPFHDWWLYLIVTGAGGVVYFDDIPRIAYRQHTTNQVGATIKLKDRINRFTVMFSGIYQRQTELNLAALDQNRFLLTERSRIKLDNFLHSRRESRIAGLIGTIKNGLYRQTIRGTIALYVGIFFKKI